MHMHLYGLPVLLIHSDVGMDAILRITDLTPKGYVITSHNKGLPHETCHEGAGTALKQGMQRALTRRSSVFKCFARLIMPGRASPVTMAGAGALRVAKDILDVIIQSHHL
jgi:hypothetical protein